MDITNENFVSLLPGICETIENCDFVAIDTELSGLVRERSIDKSETPGERFSKSVRSSRGYFIMQFGLSCFKKIGTLHYSTKTYNFYIFPQAQNSYGDIDRTFSLQAHAIQFLTEHNFDFNRLFKSGVSYLTFEEKKLLTAQLKQEAKDRALVEFNQHGVPKFVPIAMMSFCKQMIQKVNNFVKQAKEKSCRDAVESSSCSDAQSDRLDGDNDNQAGNVDKTLDCCGKGSILELREFGNHSRRLLKKMLECLPVADNIIVNERVDSKTNEAYFELEFVESDVKVERQKSAMVAAKGFLEIIETIILTKKPIVGHNLLLDLVQIVNQFIEQLDEDYGSFKETCRSLFPLIYDTKYIAHSILDPETLTNNQSRLNDLFCQLRLSKSFPRVQVDHIGIEFDENQLPHQAGYDAFMSGFCFAALCEAYLKQKFKYRTDQDLIDSLRSVAQEGAIIKDFANKIHMSFSNDYKCYDISEN